MKDKLRFFSPVAGLSLAWALSLWAASYAEFSPQSTVEFFLYTLIILAVEFTLFVLAWPKDAMADDVSEQFKLRVGFFLSLNLMSISLVQIGFFAGLGPAKTLFLLLSLWLVFYVSAHWLGTKRFALLALVLLVIIGGHSAWQVHEAGQTPDFPLPAHFTYPTFKTRPNVYLISFDALIPEAMAKHFMQIEELEYVKVLKDQGLRVLRNSFTHYPGTLISLNSMLTMDKGFWESTKRSHEFLLYNVTTPLYDIFKQNGYKTQFMYQFSFGSGQKSRLDRYEIAVPDSICGHISVSYSLLGFCHNKVQRGIKNLKKMVFGISPETEGYPDDFVFSRIRRVAAEGTPWLTLAYVFSPGHTIQSEPLAGYIANFKAVRKKATAQHINTLINTIKNHDPDSILVIFGDHGAYFKDHLKLNVIEDGQDSHAVVIAVHPHDFCAEEFSKEPYAVQRIGRSIVKCLSGVDPLPAEYQADDSSLAPLAYQ